MEEKVTEAIGELLEQLRARRDTEVTMANEVLSQYVTDHKDKEAWRQVDSQVRQLAVAWDRMILLLEKTIEKAVEIEQSVENFYGK